MLDISPDGAIATYTLGSDRLDRATALDLTMAVASIAESRSLRVFRLLSAGADFCLGSGPDLDPIDVIPDPASMLASLGAPVIVGSTGACNDVGLELLLASDIRVTDQAGTFRLGHLSQNTIPCWGGTQRLARAIRPAEAVSMTLLGTTLDAVRATSLGLIHTMVADVAEEVDRISEQICSVGPLAAQFAKEAVHRGSELPLRDGLRLEADLNHQLASTSDRAEGLAAFFDKRPPDFAGR